MSNPLITKQRSLLPGQVFRLPSRGVFYKDKNILTEDVVDGEVLIYPMRLREELAMKAVDAIFQGTAITETIQYCVPQILDPSQLVSEDIDYLLTAIKKITHGNFIKYRDRCFKKDNEELNESDIVKENAKRDLENEDKSEDMFVSTNDMNVEEGNEKTDTENNNIEIDSEFCEFQIPISHFLDTCKEIDVDNYEQHYVTQFNNFTLHVKPISLNDFKELSTLRLTENKINGDDEYIEYITAFSNANICSRLEKVDDITDKKIIYEWVDSLDTTQREELFKKLSNISDWGMDFSYEITCPKCGIKKKTNQSYINPLYFFF